MPTSSLEIPFAWSRDLRRYVTPMNVANGLKCNCICPICKKDLIARQGDIKAWHFAHTSEEDDQACKNTGMTVWHRMVQDIFQDSLGQEIDLGLCQKTYIREVKAEYQLKHFPRVADLMVLLEPSGYDKFWCVIEICVTNPKDDDFALDMKKAGAPVVELKIETEFMENKMRITGEVAPIMDNLKKRILENSTPGSPFNARWMSLENIPEGLYAKTALNHDIPFDCLPGNEQELSPELSAKVFYLLTTANLPRSIRYAEKIDAGFWNSICSSQGIDVNEYCAVCLAKNPRSGNCRKCRSVFKKRLKKPRLDRLERYKAEKRLYKDLDDWDSLRFLSDYCTVCENETDPWQDLCQDCEAEWKKGQIKQMQTWGTEST